MDPIVPNSSMDPIPLREFEWPKGRSHGIKQCKSLAISCAATMFKLRNGLRVRFCEYKKAEIRVDDYDDDNESRAKIDSGTKKIGAMVIFFGPSFDVFIFCCRRKNESELRVTSSESQSSHVKSF
jgi:hypothetical protein